MRIRNRPQLSVGANPRSVRKIFNSLHWEGCGWISWWQGGVYTSFQANKSVNETPLYTLPGEGIAQSSLFLFLPNTFGANPVDQPYCLLYIPQENEKRQLSKTPQILPLT